jgi:hypothetical protein
MTEQITQLNVEQQSVVKQAEEFAGQISTFKITCQSEYDQAGEFRKTIKTRYKEIEEMRFSFTRPLDALKKRWTEIFQAPLDKLTAADNALNRARISYYNEIERKRQEEQDKINREAERKRLEAEKKAEAARQAGDDKKAEKYERKAEQIIAPVIAPNINKTEGTSIRKTWKFQITDENLIPREYLMPDTVAIGKMIRARGDKANIPGVKVFSEENEVVRTK